MSDSKHIPDPVLQRAQKRIKVLSREIEDIKGFIKIYERFAAGVDEDIDDELRLRERLKLHEAPPPRVKSSPQTEVERVVREILKKRDRPISSAEMLQLVTERGITIGGKEPRWNLSAKLSRMEDVENIEGAGWWLKNIPWKASKYILENEGPDA
jgi:hypothetical protein